MIAVPETSSINYYIPAWYPDSGPTNYVTPDSLNLMRKSAYKGDTRVKVANEAAS